MGILTRYFLRRYAQARRNPNNAIPYATAIFELSVVSVMAPVGALYSIFGISNLRWPVLSHQHIAQLANLWVATTFGSVVLAIAYFLFARKFSKYRFDSAMYLEFDSERDRKIVFWQKLICIAVCAWVVPAATFLVVMLVL